MDDRSGLQVRGQVEALTCGIPIGVMCGRNAAGKIVGELLERGLLSGGHGSLLLSVSL